MGARLRQAAADGLVLGVKYGIALAVVIFVLAWALNDYNVLRERARNGQIAFEYLQRQAQGQVK